MKLNIGLHNIGRQYLIEILESCDEITIFLNLIFFFEHIGLTRLNTVNPQYSWGLQTTVEHGILGAPTKNAIK